MVHERQNCGAIEQQALALTGVGHIAKLVRGNAQLLGENLTVSACLVEHIHEVGVFKDVLYLAAAQKVFDILGDTVDGKRPFEQPDLVLSLLLNQAGGDRQILAKQLGISTHQLSYVTHSGEGEGLLFYGSTILPFVDHFPKSTELYRIMTTKPQELKKKEDE